MSKSRIFLSVLFVFLVSNLSYAQGVPAEDSFYSVMAGTLKNANVLYKNATTVTVDSGYGDCNRMYWEIQQPLDVNLSGTLAANDFTYIYIDYASSSFPTPTITGSTTEPAYSHSKQGWYNGDNRCIGVVWANESAQITQFKSYANGNTVETYLLTSNKYLVDKVNPDGNYITLDGTGGKLDSAVYVPVNATAIRIVGFLEDNTNGTKTILQVSAAELISESDMISWGGGFAGDSAWVMLGASRRITYRGMAYNDSLSVRAYGWKMRR